MKYTCPCCGHKTFNEPPGSFDICPICYWQDDIMDLLAISFTMGPR
jgi:hypothetical protein